MAKKAKAKKSKAKTAKTSKASRRTRRDQQKPETRINPKAAADAVKAMAQAAVVEPPPSPPFAPTLRAINARFVRSMPQAVVSSGVHEPDNDNPVDAKDVPNGRYRVDGSDFIIEVKGEKVVLFERAQPTSDPRDVIAVPSHA